MSQRPRRLLSWPAAFLLVPALVALVHWRVVLPGQAFINFDLPAFFIQMRDALQQSLRHGDLPTWQRGIFLGFPFFADPQVAAFEPTAWLTLGLAPARALTVGTLLHLVLAGWGTLYWVRQRGLGPSEGLLAAVIFALGGKVTAHLLHWNFPASLCWWPFMLGGIEGFVRRGRGRHLAVTAVAGCLSWFGGAPQMGYFGTVVTGLYALVHAPVLWRRRPMDALLALAAAPLGFVVAAPSVLPVSELAALGPRGAGVDYAFATSWNWTSWRDLFVLVVPRAYGMGWGYRGPLNGWEMTGYVGVFALALACAAPLRQRGNATLAAVAVLGIAVGFGERAPLHLHWLLYRFLPGFGNFRNPTRLALVSALCVAVLAAEGLAAIRTAPRRTLRAALVLGLCEAAALAFLFLVPGFPPEGIAQSAAITGAVAAAGFAFLWLSRRGLAVGLAAAAIALLDFGLNFRDANPVGPVSEQGPKLLAAQPLLPAPPAPRRVAVLTWDGFGLANDVIRHDWEGVNGWGPTMIGRVRALLGATRDGHLGGVPRVRQDTLWPHPDPTSPYWPLLACPLVLSDEQPALPPAGAPVPAEGRRLQPYRAPALPRVYWTGAYTVASDAAVAAPLLRAAGGAEAVVAAADPALPPSGAPAGPIAASAVAVDGPELEAELDAPRDGLAVVVDPWFPGWRATVDGRPAALVRANYAFMAVPVKAGRHALRLEYRPRLLWPGVALSAAALLGLAAALGWRHRHPVKQGAAGSGPKVAAA
ncbi:YfhO family protein [Anaeromyxobacter paludicola]|uniref:YfhO family protein n=1 Tax=Anaeromyxobacter paludicola TaxID=2918171 RepID=A0ABM7XCP3_9BACT|nr:YfhO family protein [Anaeromyxobacter paludicola]BDG09578.1 hypothetical protein AMPC_26910 [Anaeromyxobacter paludicola]